MSTTVSLWNDAVLGRLESTKDRPCRTILYLDHTAKMGGGEIALLNLVSALDKEYYRPIVVLAAHGPLVGKLRAAGIETHVEPLDRSVLETRKDSISPKSLLRIGQAWACIEYAFRIARLARRLGADLIHTNSLKADLYGGLAGRLAGIPVLWHVRDNIDGHYLPPQVAATFRGLSRIIPKAVVANSQSTLRTLHPVRWQLAATVYSGTASSSFGASSVTASSTGIAASSTSGPLGLALIPALGGRDMRQQVVHDGYDAQAFESYQALKSKTREAAPGDLPPRASLPPPQGSGVMQETGIAQQEIGGAQRAAVIALVGRFAEWKGQHIFIQAAALVRDKFPQARFQIIGAPLFGEYEYEQSLHQMVNDLGITDRIEFLGFREDVPALLAEVDIVVHASTLGEPFGQVVIEGMAAGKPVIATDGGALPEIVIPGETGLLVTMGDAPAMAEAVCRLLADPVEAAAMGLAGRQRVQERFTIALTAGKIKRVYDYLLK